MASPRLLETRPETAAVLGPTVAAGAMVAQFVMGKATRDALFLSHFSVELLPRVMVASTVLSGLAALLSSGALAKRPPERVVGATFAASAAILLGLFALGRGYERQVALAVYGHVALFGAALTAAFWSLVAESFDPRAAKRCVGRIAAGATLGGVIGGLAAWLLPARIGVVPMLLVMAALHALAGACVRGLKPPSSPRARLVPPARPSMRAAGAPPVGSGIRALASDGYLRALGLFVLISAAAQALLDYMFTSQAAAEFGRGPALLSYFAAYQTAVGVLSLALQAAAGRPALERLGLAGTVALLPAAVAGSSLLYGALPRLWTAALLRGADGTLRASLFRSAYEVLYAPVAPEVRRRVKALIDVGCDRAGSAFGAGLVAALIALAPGHRAQALAAGALAASAALLALIGRLRRGYVASLESSLRRGAIDLGRFTVTDATTRDTLSQTFGPMSAAAPGLTGEGFGPQSMHLSPRSLAFAPDEASLSMLGTAAFGLSVPGVLDLPEAPEEPPSRPADPAVAVTADLRSGVPARARAALGPEFSQLHPLLAPHLVDLVGHDALSREACVALEACAPRVTGLLVDALVDPARPRAVRRRVARVLGRCPSRRAIDGLVLGLRDARFDVRFACGRALAVLAKRSPDLAVPEAPVLEAASAELRVGAAAWDGEWSPEVDDEPDADHARVARERVGRGVEHVFTLLSLCLPREPLHIAFRALATDDERLRGTALEYLHSTLPAELRDELMARLEGPRSHRPPSRTRAQLAEALVSARDAIARKLGEPAAVSGRGADSG